MPASSAENAAVAVSEVVRAHYSEAFGSPGATVRTVTASGLAVTVVEQSFTPAEHRAIAAGRADSVLNARVQWQHASHAKLTTEVERATGLTVKGVVSGTAIRGATCSEVFLLEDG